MEYHCSVAEHSVYNTQVNGMANIIGDGAVIDEELPPTSASMLLQASLLIVENFNIAIRDGSIPEIVKRLPHSGCAWILWCGYLLMVRADMLDKEVRV